MNTKLLCVASLLIGLVIGMQFGRNQTPVAPEPPLEDMQVRIIEPVSLSEEQVTPTGSDWLKSLDEIRFRLVQPQWFHQGYRVIETLASVDIADLPKLARALTQEIRAETAIRVAFARWAEHDPQPALAAANEVGDLDVRKEALIGVYTGWVVVDLVAAKESLEAMKPGKLRDDLGLVLVEEMAVRDPAAALEMPMFRASEKFYSSANSIIVTWANTDPEALRSWISTATDEGLKSCAESALEEHRIRHDPQGMVEYIATLEDSAEFHRLSGRLVSSWYRQDPDAVERWMRTLQQVKTRQRVVALLASEMKVEDPRRAAELIRTHGVGSQRRDMQRDLAESWASRDITAALEWFHTLSVSGQRATVWPILSRLADVEPERAAEVLGSLSASTRAKADGLVSAIAGTWGVLNPEKALEWIGTLPSSDSLQASWEFASSVVNVDREKALALVDQMQGDRRDTMLHAIAREWALTDRAAALDWVDSLPEEESINVKTTVIIAIADTKPRVAAETVSAMPAGEAQDQVAAEVVQRWGFRDPAATMEWVATFPTGELRENSIFNILPRWSKEDPEAAEKFIEDLADTDIRREAAEHLINGIVSELPARAANWLNEIEDQATKRRLTKVIGENWLEQDDAKAREWLRQVGFTVEQIKNPRKDDPHSESHGLIHSGAPVLDAMGNPIRIR